MTDNQDNGEEAAEQALAQAKQQTRHTSEPSTSGADTVNQVDAIKDALLSIEAGESPENINLRDKRLKAMLVGLDDAGQLGVVAESLADVLGDDLDSGSVSQSEVARMLIRVGLQESLPGVRDDMNEAAAKAARESTESY